MPVIFKAKVYEVPSEGLHNARLVNVTDLGVAINRWNEEQNRLQFDFILDQKSQKTGKPLTVKYEINMTGSQKGHLLPLYRALTGLKNASIPAGFDFETLIGSYCQLLIEHNAKSDGAVFVDIKGAFTADPRALPLTVPANYVKVMDRESTAYPAPEEPQIPLS